MRDAVVPALILLLDVVVVLLTRQAGDRQMVPFGWALTVVASAVLVWRQRFPVVVIVATGVVSAVYYPLGFPDSPVALNLVVALYTVARVRGPVVSGVAAGVLLVGFMIPAGGVKEQLGAAAGVAPILLSALVLGEIARDRARRLAEADRRAVEAEAAREAEALRRVAEERLRIARELHDVLAHQISLINVQAGAALHVGEPEGAFAALGAIRVASKEALQEVRAVLGVLRDPGEGRPGEAQFGEAQFGEPDAQPGEMGPALSLDRLPELISRTEAAGLRVEAIVEVPALARAVEFAVYRIVQEALTNAVRHSRAKTAAVEVRRAGDRITVTVDDDGPMEPDEDGTAKPDKSEMSGNAGNGLRGMAERVAALGGTLEAGPRPEGGFRVWAQIPAAHQTDGNE